MTRESAITVHTTPDDLSDKEEEEDDILENKDDYYPLACKIETEVVMQTFIN